MKGKKRTSAGKSASVARTSGRSRLVNRPGEHSHFYGENVHLPIDPYAEALLGQFSIETPGGTLEVRRLAEELAQLLMVKALNTFAKTEPSTVITRMGADLVVPSFTGPDFAVVNILSAGDVPSNAGFDALLKVAPNARIEPVMAERDVDGASRVTGCTVTGMKADRPMDGTLIILDPMGATGSTAIKVVREYENRYGTSAIRNVWILTFIAAPEFLQNIRRELPHAKVMTLRLDRGLSSKKALAAKPGRYPKEERGTTEMSYIKPGAGDAGKALSGRGRRRC